MRYLASPALASWFMFTAVALMLAAPDHWDLPWPGAHSHGEHASDHEETHSRHCHGEAATCTDLPLTGTGGLAVLGGWLAVPATFVLVPFGTVFERPVEHARDVLTPPPRPG